MLFGTKRRIRRWVGQKDTSTNALIPRRGKPMKQIQIASILFAPGSYLASCKRPHAFEANTASNHPPSPRSISISHGGLNLDECLDRRIDWDGSANPATWSFIPPSWRGKAKIVFLVGLW
eukprot:scaffold2318_cov363-Pavlova_lutheri.AAC.10